MCVITLVPLGIETPLEEIENGACANPDGHGWAVASAKFGLVTGKSMDPKAAMEAFVAECERQGGSAAVRLFHSRIGTHGTMNVDNVHPFLVPDTHNNGHDHTTVMAHNGVMPDFWHPNKDDPRSDTRVFVDVTAKWYLTARGVPSRRGAKTLGTIIGGYNKLVFLSTRVAGKPAVRIINSTSGVWDGGVWYSNSSYKRKVYRAWRNGSAYSSNPNNYVHRSTAKTCTVKGCNTTGYTSDFVTCYVHRPLCIIEGCTEKRTSGADVTCYGHLPSCAEEKCERKPYGDSFLCWQHRTSAVPTKEVEPYSYGGYNLYGGHAADTWPVEADDVKEPDLSDLEAETQTLLDDIEVTLAEAGHDVTDVYEDKPCDVCQVRGKIHIATNLCLACKWCLDCWDTYDNCTCFDYTTWMAMREIEESELSEALAREFEGEKYLATAKAKDKAVTDVRSPLLNGGEPLTFEEWQARRESIMAFYGLTHEDMTAVDLVLPPPEDNVIPLAPPEVPTVGTSPVVEFSPPTMTPADASSEEEVEQD